MVGSLVMNIILELSGYIVFAAAANEQWKVLVSHESSKAKK